MAVETQRALPGTVGSTAPAQSLLRSALLVTAAMIGISGAAAALLGAVSGFLVYQYARARGQWGTDEPPEGTAEEISFSSSDDHFNISGWFFRARRLVRPGPAIVLCHGIWTGRRECLPLALRFQANGYNVLCFDFRAHGLSDGRFTTVGLHETNDVIGAVEYLKRRPEVDSTRIGVLGFSMGAAATIQAAARCPDIAAVVADSAYASFLDAVKYSFQLVTRVPTFPFANMAHQWGKLIVRIDAGRLRPVDVIAQISPRPILLMHGTLDEIVPLEHAHSLFSAAAEPKELWVVEGSHHVGARDDYPDRYFEKVEQFMRQSLNPGAAAHPIG
jgi:fermentation-respiration switch protein FrsA (DUF1100 family)